MFKFLKNLFSSMGDDFIDREREAPLKRSDLYPAAPSGPVDFSKDGGPQGKQSSEMPSMVHGSALLDGMHLPGNPIVGGQPNPFYVGDD